MTPHIETTVECDGWRDVANLDELIEQCISTALVVTEDTMQEGAEVSLLLCDDAQIRALNARFRGIDRPTNVLSFPGPEPVDEAKALGDIAVAFETVAREAEEQGKPLSDHLCHMVVHGFLHLLGFDHETDEEADAMEAIETCILAQIGVADPYGEPENLKGEQE